MAEEPPPLDRAERQSLGGVLRSLPRPQVPSGNGTITGHVRRAGGAPLEGVTVRAHLRRESSGWRQGDGPPEDVSEVESVRRYVADRRRRRGTRGEAVTDHTGAYTVEGLVKDARYSLRAYREGFQINPVLSRNAWNAAPGSEIDFHAEPLVAVPVDVRLPDGAQPARAEITVKQGNSTTTAIWTPRQPVLRARPGDVTLRATIPSDDELHSTEIQLKLAEGQAVKTQAFELQSRPGVRGQVRFPNGEHAGYLNVYLLQIGAGTQPQPAGLTQHGQQTWVSADEGYGYSYKDLAPGRYMVGVALGRNALLAHKTVTVLDHMVDCVFEITEFDPSQFVVLKVYAPDGSLLADANIDTAYRRENSSSSGGGQSMRRKDGSYLVAHHATDDVSDGGTYYVTVKSDRFGTKEVGYQRGKIKELEVRFLAPAVLKVTVAGYVGSGQEELISVALKAIAGEEDGFRSSGASKKPTAAGTLELGPAEPGEYEVVVYAGKARYGGLRASATPVSLRAGQNEVTVAMPRLHSLTVEVPGGKAGETLRLRNEVAGGWSATSGTLDDQGRATFELLPEGRYKISREAAGEMVISIPGPGLVVFKGQVQNAILIKVTDAAGTIAKAGFMDGDLVIGIGGQEFSNMLQMQMLFAGAATKERSTLILLRGGRRMELTVDLRGLMQGGGNRGGSFDTTSR
jgi:hypothetical protein